MKTIRGLVKRRRGLFLDHTDSLGFILSTVEIIGRLYLGMLYNHIYLFQKNHTAFCVENLFHDYKTISNATNKEY